MGHDFVSSYAALFPTWFHWKVIELNENVSSFPLLTDEQLRPEQNSRRVVDDIFKCIFDDKIE